MGHVGEQLLHGVDADEAGGVVERRDLAKFLDFRDGLVVNQAALGEVFAAVSDAVTDGSNLVKGSDDAHFRVGECIQHQLDADSVVRNGGLGVVFVLADRLVGEFAHLETDALHQTFGFQLGIVGHVNELVLEGRTSAVDD